MRIVKKTYFGIKITLVMYNTCDMYLYIYILTGSKEFQDLTASTWVNTTCRDIQTAIIKTCAYNNRSALKLAFGEEYDKLYPGSIYSPPSYNENFSSSEG